MGADRTRQRRSQGQICRPRKRILVFKAEIQPLGGFDAIPRHEFEKDSS